MKLHVLSDLHTEFTDFSPPESDADVVILAGDIGVGLGGIEWAARRYPRAPVIYVPGNHEFYAHDIGLTDSRRDTSLAGLNLRRKTIRERLLEPGIPEQAGRRYREISARIVDSRTHPRAL